MRVGINGMGRIGRLALRAEFGAARRPDEYPYRAIVLMWRTSTS
jgi:glyceraldehyde 3-phosphate dehydrogenase